MEGDSNILDLVEPADRKGDRSAQKIRAHLGDLYHKHEGNKTQKRFPRAEDSEAMFWQRSRILSIEGVWKVFLPKARIPGTLCIRGYIWNHSEDNRSWEV